MKKINCLVFFLALVSCSFAQQTGSFQLSIDFDEPDYNFTRNLYFHVPSDYDENQAYKLVVGFRGGPHSNAGQFRDQLTFLSDSLNAIILCPENSGHFWNEEGLTKQLFQYSLDTIMGMYNIDSEFIYLTGLSYGGRHAVIVSMDTDDGPIPGIRGVIPFAAGSESHLAPNYDAIEDFAPACICIGLSDASNFINVSNSLHNDITTNGGASILNEIPGVGHTVAFSTFPEEMMECINFIEDQYESTSVEEELINLAREIQIFPNPAKETISISFPESWEVEKILILDNLGTPLMQLDAPQKNISLSKLDDGVKLLRISTKKGWVSKQFLKID